MVIREWIRTRRIFLPPWRQSRFRRSYSADWSLSKVEIKKRDSVFPPGKSISQHSQRYCPV
ncbi:unnamed protein product [Rhodiola kirilowii]